jgi:site-specific recombinase XerD
MTVEELFANRDQWQALADKARLNIEQVQRRLANQTKKLREAEFGLQRAHPSTRMGVRDRAILHLALCAGLGVSELTGLRIDDVAPQPQRDFPNVFCCLQHDHCAGMAKHVRRDLFAAQC